jgi:phosphatidylcholine synthase
MIKGIAAATVHILTASGAVLALLALQAAHVGDIQMMFVWLGIALVADAVDGPLARAIDVKTVLPRFSGERLDLIVDYLTYDAVPAFALIQSDLLPEPFRLPAAIAHPLVEPVPCLRCREQEQGGLFRRILGHLEHHPSLPLCAVAPPYVALAIVAGFVALTFVPILCVHPFRVARLRPLTCLVTLIWIGAAAIAVAQPFPSPLWVQTLLLVTAAYFSTIGFARSLAQS